MSKLPTASPWIEEVTFVECPHCGCVESLGTDACVGKEDAERPFVCEDCGQEYLIEEME